MFMFYVVLPLFGVILPYKFLFISIGLRFVFFWHIFDRCLCLSIQVCIVSGVCNSGI